MSRSNIEGVEYKKPLKLYRQLCRERDRENKRIKRLRHNRTSRYKKSLVDAWSYRRTLLHDYSHDEEVIRARYASLDELPVMRIVYSIKRKRLVRR